MSLLEVLKFYIVAVGLCFKCFSCGNIRDPDSNLYVANSVPQTFGFMLNENGLPFDKGPPYYPYSRGSASLMNFQQNIMKRLGTLGNSQTIAAGVDALAGSGFRTEDGGAGAGGVDNGRLSLGLREVETFPRQKQRIRVPMLQGHKMKLNLFSDESVGNTLNNHLEPLGITKLSTQRSNDLFSGGNAFPNNSFERRLKQQIKNAFPNLYQVTSTNMDPNMYQITSTNMDPNMYQVTSKNMDPNMYQVTSTNMDPNMYQVTSNNMDPNMYQVTSTNMDPNMYQVTSTNMGPNMYQVTSTNMDPNMYQLTWTDMDPNMYQVTWTNMYPNVYHVTTTNIDPNMYPVASTNIDESTMKQNEGNIHDSFLGDRTKSKTEKSVLLNPIYDGFINGQVITGSTRALKNGQNKYVKSLLRVIKNKNDSQALPVNNDLYEKKIIRIITRTETGLLNSVTGIVNLILASSTSGTILKEEQPEKNIENYGDDCEICKTMNKVVNDKTDADKRNTRYGIDPNCEICINEQKANSKDTAMGPKNELCNKNPDKLSSRNNICACENAAVKLVSEHNIRNSEKNSRRNKNNNPSEDRPVKHEYEGGNSKPEKISTRYNNDVLAAVTIKIENGHNNRKPQNASSRCNNCLSEGNGKNFSRTKNELSGRVENLNRTKIKLTSCRPEECIRKIKELLENIEASTSYHTVKEKSDQNTELYRDHEEDLQTKKSKKVKITIADDVYETETRKLRTPRPILDKNINAMYSDKRDRKDKNTHQYLSDNLEQRAYTNTKYNGKGNQKETSKLNTSSKTIDKRVSSSSLKFKNKRKRKRAGDNKDSKDKIQKYIQDEDIEDYENRKRNYAKVNDNADDGVQVKANNMRFLLLEKINSQINNDDEEDEDYEEDDEDYEEPDNNKTEIKDHVIDEKEKDNIQNGKKHLKYPNMDEDVEFDKDDVADNNRNRFLYLLKIPVRIVNKVRSMVEYNLDRLDIDSNPDVIILTLLLIIIVLLVGIFITVKRFNRKHELLLDSQTDMQWIALNMHSKYDSKCPHAAMPQVFHYQEPQSKLNTDPSYSEILKDLYLPDQSSPQTSLYTRLPIESQDEDLRTRKILHGKRHCSTTDLNKEKK